MALLAIGFTWSPLLFFIVPLIVAAGLSRMGFGSLAPIIIAISLSLLLGVLFSLYYWRYPFGQPRLLKDIREFTSIEQLSQVGISSKGATALAFPSIPPASSLEWNTNTELIATDRILQDFGNRKLDIQSTVPIPSELLMSIWNAANENGLLIEGDVDYPDAKTLSGFVGIGRRKDGSRLAFATLMGFEHSNDHYPYYEFVIPMDQSRLEITKSQWFFVDIAGLEGFNWLAFALVSFIFVTLPAACVALLLSAFFPKRRRRQWHSVDGQKALTVPAGAPSHKPL